VACTKALEEGTCSPIQRESRRSSKILFVKSYSLRENSFRTAFSATLRVRRAAVSITSPLAESPVGKAQASRQRVV
jgi:hypothetical protein